MSMDQPEAFIPVPDSILFSGLTDEMSQSTPPLEISETSGQVQPSADSADSTVAAEKSEIEVSTNELPQTQQLPQVQMGGNVKSTKSARRRMRSRIWKMENGELSWTWKESGAPAQPASTASLPVGTAKTNRKTRRGKRLKQKHLELYNTEGCVRIRMRSDHVEVVDVGTQTCFDKEPSTSASRYITFLSPTE